MIDFIIWVVAVLFATVGVTGAILAIGCCIDKEIEEDGQDGAVYKDTK